MFTNSYNSSCIFDTLGMLYVSTVTPDSPYIVHPPRAHTFNAGLSHPMGEIKSPFKRLRGRFRVNTFTEQLVGNLLLREQKPSRALTKAC